MKFIFALLFTTVTFAMAANEQPVAGVTMSSRELAQCGALFELLASSSNGVEKSRNELASTALQAEAYKGATPTEVKKWMSDYLLSLPDKSAGPDVFFEHIKNTYAKCRPAATIVVKAVLDKARAGAKDNRITDRYQNGRPKAALVYDKNVYYSDSEGLSCETPVLLSGTEDRDASVRSQYLWLEDQRPTLKVKEHSTTFSGNATTKEALKSVRIYSKFDLAENSAGLKVICFDITDSAKAGLIKGAGE